MISLTQTLNNLHNVKPRICTDIKTWNINRNLFLKLIYLEGISAWYFVCKFCSKASKYGSVEAVNIMFFKPAHHQHSPSADKILSSETVSTHIPRTHQHQHWNPEQTPNLFSEWWFGRICFLLELILISLTFIWL